MAQRIPAFFMETAWPFPYDIELSSFDDYAFDVHQRARWPSATDRTWQALVQGRLGRAVMRAAQGAGLAADGAQEGRGLGGANSALRRADELVYVECQTALSKMIADARAEGDDSKVKQLRQLMKGAVNSAVNLEQPTATTGTSPAASTTPVIKPPASTSPVNNLLWRRLA